MENLDIEETEGGSFCLVVCFWGEVSAAVITHPPQCSGELTWFWNAQHIEQQSFGFIVAYSYRLWEEKTQKPHKRVLMFCPKTKLKHKSSAFCCVETQFPWGCIPVAEPQYSYLTCTRSHLLQFVLGSCFLYTFKQSHQSILFVSRDVFHSLSHPIFFF